MNYNTQLLNGVMIERNNKETIAMGSQKNKQRMITFAAGTKIFKNR